MANKNGKGVELKNPKDLREAVATVADCSCLFVETVVNGHTLWLGITGFKPEGQTIEGGLILKAEPIDAEVLKRIGLPNDKPGTVHFHSSHKHFCGSVSMGREWSQDASKVNCENCRKNAKKVA